MNSKRRMTKALARRSKYRIALPVPKSQRHACPPCLKISVVRTTPKAPAPASDYLKDVPGLPDFLAHLAGYRKLTSAEMRCLDKHIARLTKLIREARGQGEAKQQDAAYVA